MRPDSRLTDRARREGYPARSVYKLKDLDRDFHLFFRGEKVLDLGAHPGSWSLYALEMVGRGGLVVSVDRKRCPSLENRVHHIIEADVMEMEEGLLSPFSPFDCVLSDLSASTTGIRFADQFESIRLVRRAWHLASLFLRRGGRFVCKVFMSQEVNPFERELKRYFSKVSIRKPEGSRKRSSEVYIVCTGFTGKR